MKIGGLIKTTLIDYPGLVACTIFTIGCNFSCPECHNKDLVNKDGPYKFPMSTLLKFLEERQTQLDGVVVSGGEPTIQPDLTIFLKAIKRMGYKIKLDTNGSNPETIKKNISLDLLDFIAMDIKGVSTFSDIKTYGSIDIIISSKIPHLFRTTAVRPTHKERDFYKIASILKASGSTSYIVYRGIINDEVLNPSYFKGYRMFTVKEIKKINDELYSKHTLLVHRVI